MQCLFIKPRRDAEECVHKNGLPSPAALKGERITLLLQNNLVAFFQA
jgi:hypothetical protein